MRATTVLRSLPSCSSCFELRRAASESVSKRRQALARLHQRRTPRRRERAAAHAHRRSPVRPRLHLVRRQRPVDRVPGRARRVAAPDGRGSGGADQRRRVLGRAAPVSGVSPRERVAARGGEAVRGPNLGDPQRFVGRPPGAQVLESIGLLLDFKNCNGIRCHPIPYKVSCPALSSTVTQQMTFRASGLVESTPNTASSWRSCIDDHTHPRIQRLFAVYDSLDLS